MIIYEGVAHTTCHAEIVPGTIIRSETVEECVGYKWMVVKLSNGVNRDVIVTDVKVLGEK
jgi:hypothetical protein